jgi:hypothetical protein
VQKFSKVSGVDVLMQAKRIWDHPQIAVERHMRGTDAYHARLFGVFLTNSIMNEFLAVLYSRIDPKYSMDGPLLVHTMCHHIHCNHVAFVESIKDKKSQTTLAEHKDDMVVYLRFLKNNLWSLFQQAVLKLAWAIYGREIVNPSSSACPNG